MGTKPLSQSDQHAMTVSRYLAGMAPCSRTGRLGYRLIAAETTAAVGGIMRLRRELILQLAVFEARVLGDQILLTMIVIESSTYSS
jgi:hypothetical protein